MFTVISPEYAWGNEKGMVMAAVLHACNWLLVGAKAWKLRADNLIIRLSINHDSLWTKYEYRNLWATLALAKAAKIDHVSRSNLASNTDFTIDRVWKQILYATVLHMSDVVPDMRYSYSVASLLWNKETYLLLCAVLVPQYPTNCIDHEQRALTKKLRNHRDELNCVGDSNTE